MKKYIPYEKLSKRIRKVEDRKKRVMWTDMGIESPVTKVSENKKAYLREKFKRVDLITHGDY